MEFNINGKKYTLKFGMKFAREMDKVFKVDQHGLEFGMGISMAFMNLSQSNPTVLTDIILAATAHEKNALSVSDVDEALETYAEENDGFGKLFDDIQTALGKSPVAKDTVQKFQELAKESEEDL